MGCGHRQQVFLLFDSGLNVCSGIHNILAAKEDINVLVIDGENYSQTFGKPRARAKKDIGLYAMNYGNSSTCRF